MINDPSAILAAGAGTTSGFADRTIATAQQQIKQIPDDYKAYVDLGYAFQQKARETNDPISMSRLKTPSPGLSLSNPTTTMQWRDWDN